MLRYKTKLDLVWSTCKTSSQEMEWLYSYNPKDRMGCRMEK